MKSVIKKTIKSLPFAKATITKLKFGREYSYDRKFFAKNYSHSTPTKAKIGYNMLLISHSLEKGMSNKNPRHFGTAKVDELIKLIREYEAYGDYENDSDFVNAINVLRNYAKFYEEKKWTDAGEYEKVSEFLKDYSDVAKMNVGSFVLEKKDFEKDAAIDYRKFLASRHSVREFSTKKLDEKDLKKAIETAILSPSACNRQMIKVYYISDPAKSKKLISIAQGFGGFEKETINSLVITFDVNANYFIGERNQGWFNAGLFSMNLVNALHSQGIGSCFCQFGNSTKQEEQLKKLLDIPASERIAVILSAGYYCDKSTIPYSPRKKIEDVYRKR